MNPFDPTSPENRYRTLAEMRERRPEQIIRLAVRRMLPKTRLGRNMLKKLKIYAGAEHPHAGVNALELKV